MSRKSLRDPEPFRRFLESLEASATQEVPAWPEMTVDELRRIRAFLLGRYAGATPVHSRMNLQGQIFDYFRPEEQPMLRAHNVKLATPPPSGFLGVGHVGLQLRQQRGDTKAAGLVPIRRLAVADLAEAKTLDRFLHKRRAAHRSLLRSPEAAAPRTPETDHRWADVWQSIGNSGAVSTLNIWSPPLAVGQSFSLSQIWCVADGSSGRQTVEVGWHVNPLVTKHNMPAMFVYWTRDGYASTGSYNGYQNDFQYSSNSTVLGTPISDFSVSGGTQHEICCVLKLHEGNWWVYIGGDQNDNAVGCFPGALYNGGPLASGAAEVDFGGEVCGGPPFPPMGSGTFASAGWAQAAYQRNLGIIDAAGNVQNSLNLQNDQADSVSFTVDPGTSNDWGEYFYFGGPGGN